MRSTLCQSFERIVNPGDGRASIALEQVSTLPCTKTLLHTAPTAFLEIFIEQSLAADSHYPEQLDIVFGQG